MISSWTGPLPKHWNTAKLKWLSKIYAGGTPDKSNSAYWENGTIPWLNSGTVNQGIITEYSHLITEQGFNNSSAKWIEKGNLIIALAGQGKTKGMVGLTTFRTTCNKSLGVISPGQKIYSKFIYYYLKRSYKNIRGLAGDGKRDGLNLEMIGSIYVPIPPFDEQVAIVEFLDIKTSQIDQSIEKRTLLIQLLQEEKSAVINEAVTRGINSRVPMKGSGIEWLREMPKHWELAKMKYLGKIKYGLGQPPKQLENGLPLIRATNIERGKIVEANMVYVDPDDVPYERDPVLRENDIIVVRSGAYTADSAIIPNKYDGAITGYDMVFRPTTVNAKFISYGLLSNYILYNQLYVHRLRAAQPHLNAEELGDTIVLIPSLEEQEEIVSHIESEISRIDKEIELAQKEIELLKEYRGALISEAVTGKIDVRDYPLN